MPRFYLAGPTDADPAPDNVAALEAGDRVLVEFAPDSRYATDEAWEFTVEEGETPAALRARIRDALQAFRASLQAERPGPRRTDVTAELDEEA